MIPQVASNMLFILGDILNYGPRNGLPEGLNPKLIAETLNAMADKIVAIRGNCDSEVDQMLLDFPITGRLCSGGRRQWAQAAAHPWP